MMSMWKDALTELVVRMYELEKEEKRLAKADPFSIMAMHAPRIDISSFALPDKLRKAGRKRRVPDGGGENDDHPDGQSTPRDEGPFPGSTTRVKMRPSSIWSHKGATENARLADLDGPIEKADGPPCSSCAAPTFVEQVGGTSSSCKSETWGFKDAPEAIYRMTCRACGVSTTYSE